MYERTYIIFIIIFKHLIINHSNYKINVFNIYYIEIENCISTETIMN